MKLFYFQFVYYLRNYLKSANLLTCSILLSISTSTYSLELFYLDKNNTVIGSVRSIDVNENDNVADMANFYKTGFQDLLIANPEAHHWSPEPHTKYVIPSMYILPQKNYNGIILNLAELRLYYYMKSSDLYENTKVLTFPVGIGRLDWKTPLGETFIKSKVESPSWYPPKSIILEHEERGEVLPREVKAGPDNPLGNFALKLDVDGGYLFHGTNKKYGIGMMVSHGCIRLRNEDIETIFYNTPLKTKVKIINEPIKLGVFNNFLYMEVHAFNNKEVYSNNQKNILTTENIYKPITAVMDFIDKNPEYEINWKEVLRIYEKSDGIPAIMGKKSNSRQNMAKN